MGSEDVKPPECVEEGLILNRWPLSLTASGHSYCPVFVQQFQPSARQQAASDTRQSELYMCATSYGYETHSVLHPEMKNLQPGRAQSDKPRGSKPDPREGTVHAGRSL